MLIQRNEVDEIVHRIRLTPKELALLFTLLEARVNDNEYVAYQEAEKACDANLDHVRQVIAHHLNIKLQAFNLEAWAVVDHGFTIINVENRRRS